MPCCKEPLCCDDKSQLLPQQPLSTVHLLSLMQHPRSPDDASDAPGCALTTSVSGAAVLPLAPRAPPVAALPAVRPAESQLMPKQPLRAGDASRATPHGLTGVEPVTSQHCRRADMLTTLPIRATSFGLLYICHRVDSGISDLLTSVLTRLKYQEMAELA